MNTNLKQKLVTMLGAVGRYLQILFNDAIHAELQVVLPIATKAIAQIAADPAILTSTAKRDAAVALIVTQLTGAQMQVGTSVINLAIELAYQQFLLTAAK